MPTLTVSIEQNTRQKSVFIPFRCKSVKYSKSFFPMMAKKKLSKSSNHVDPNKIVSCLKHNWKAFFCPKRYKFLSRGTQLWCKLLTQIRVGRSFLNSHSYTVGMSESPACICHSIIESPSHFFNDCFLYNEERRTLFSTFEQYLPKKILFFKS